MSTTTAPAPSLAARLGAVHVTLRADLEFSRHVFAGEPSYVVRDPLTFRCHNFSAADYRILTALDPERTLEETFEALVADGRLDADREEEFYRFISALHQLGFLSLPIADGGALYARFKRRRSTELRGKLLGFLFLQVPLINPDAFLTRTMRLVDPLFTRGALAAWLCLIAAAATVVIARWHSFWDPIGSLLAAGNLAYLWVSLVVLKVIHEFGHAYACKHFGGRVPEMGAFFIVFTPCAYVDATDCWGFPSRAQRIIVSLAGMYVESIVAALAVFVWAASGPSTLHSVAHQVILLSTVVTLGFNLNPLMRYDGYYVLGDLCGIPNLRQRSQAEVMALVKRWTLGIRTVLPPVSAPRRLLLVVYGVASTIYKLCLIVAIFSVIAFKVYLLGLALAVLYAALMLAGLVKRLYAYLLRSPETAHVRRRAVALGVVATVLIPLAVGLAPLPHSIDAYGVVGRETETPVCVESAGFLRKTLDERPATVAAGEVLARLDNPQLQTTLGTLRAEVQEELVDTRRGHDADPAEIQASQQRLAHLRHAVAIAEENADRLDVRAPAAGELVLVPDARQHGRFFHAGDRVATVVSGGWAVRVLIDAEQFADLHLRVGQPVDVQLVGDTARHLEGTVESVAEAGSKRIDLPALTHLGGGEIAVAPNTLESDQAFFAVQIALADPRPDELRFGMTAVVRFRAPTAPLGVELYRETLRFLDRLRARR